MSRPTIMVPFRDKRVETGYFGQFLQNIGHRLVQVNLHHVAFTGFTEFFGESVHPDCCRAFQSRYLLFIDFINLMLRSAEQGKRPDPRGKCAVTRQADDADVVSQILAAAELGQGTEANLMFSSTSFSSSTSESA